MSDYVLQTEDVAIHYGGVKAVDGVSITLERGQIRGLIGPNGAGKSTIIDAITGRRRLTRGTVMLGGENVTALGERGKFVWLRADARTLARRMQSEKNGSGQRPSLTGAGTLEEVERVLAERLPVYRAVADLAVDTAGKYPEAIAAEIAGALSESPARRRVKKDGRRTHAR